jgi:hypothetical protein
MLSRHSETHIFLLADNDETGYFPSPDVRTIAPLSVLRDMSFRLTSM